MDLCEHAYYKPEEKYMPYLYCGVDDKRCIYSKKCMKVERFIPLENEMWKECYKFIMNKRNDIPEGSYFVQTYRPNRAGRLILYVAMGDTTKKIQSRFTKLDQDYVYIDGNTISLTPIEKKNNEEIVKDSEIVEKSAPIKEKVVEKSAPKKQRGRKSKNE